MLIAIPSKSRPFKSKSKEMLPEGVLFVPENEVEIYKKIYNEVVGVPMDVKGITPTRNWILKQYPGEDVVFVDDDLARCGYWTDKEGGGESFSKWKDGKLWKNLKGYSNSQKALAIRFGELKQKRVKFRNMMKNLSC